MNAKTRSSFYLPISALILTAVLAVPAAAQKQVPFKGVLQGHDSDSPGPSAGTVVVTTTGNGLATQLGQYTFTQQVTVNLTDGTDTGFVHFVAANGDSIEATIVGEGEPIATPDGIVFSITETYTITGGTGRFAGAQGSFTGERLASPVTFFTSGSFRGAITSPGALH
jgi:hypothetical protein